MPPSPTPSRGLYIGLFILTLGTLLLELGLTRIFSVVMYYHMAFFAVSVTLFGIALGGAIVHFFPRIFTVENARTAMGWCCLGFAVTTCGALALLMNIPFDLTRNTIIVLQCCLIGSVLAVPFTLGGIAVAVALTKFPVFTPKLYGWDLAGAALGCLLFAPLIYVLGGPRFILAVTLLIAIAGLVLLLRDRRGVAAGALTCVALLALTLFGPRQALFQFNDTSTNEALGHRLVYDKWNSISRITATEMRDVKSPGVVPPLYEQSGIDQLFILIDTFAGTYTPHLPDGNYKNLFYPFHDISYVAHALVPNANVAVIGVGGGRDIVAAKAWGQPRVTGIEINGRMLEIFTRDFHDYGGRPMTWPGVSVVKDEARSYIARSETTYDIIQASLIDTFAATAAGAFVLTENSLYTKEGWHVFLDHLSSRGVLTMTRWYNPDNPVETLRLLALARAVLEERGIKNFRDHILLARMSAQAITYAHPLATILVSNTPFSPEQVATFETWCRDNHMLPLITPTVLGTPAIAEIMNAPNLGEYVRNHQFDLSPPTDNKPFFFDVLRWRDILKPEMRQGSDYTFSINFKPVIMLGTLLGTVCFLAVLFIVLPLWWESRGKLAAWPRSRRWGMVIYFMCLGLGYMLVELALLQKLSIFLGHPGYSLMVCLFTLLLASGLGSMVAPRLVSPTGQVDLVRMRWLCIAIFAVQALTLMGAEVLGTHFDHLATPARLLMAGLLLVPAGFLMGMPFPAGIQAAAGHPNAPLAWFWGINGVCSVCASVFTIVIGHSFGLAAAFMTGAACYLIAALVATTFRAPAQSA